MSSKKPSRTPGGKRVRRRPLAHVGGAAATAGDPAAAARLAHALDVTPLGDDDADLGRAHVHGFHTYPARLHPVTAARLVSAFTAPGDRILDPFCGSGTVLVEALALGRRPLGVDLNPLAVRLTRAKARVRSAAELNDLVRRAKTCAARADALRRSRTAPDRSPHPDDRRLFEPHVLFELDALRAAVESTRDESIRDDLSLVLSAVLVKLSRRRGDTTPGLRQRRTAPGFPARTFAAKADEFARRLAEFAALVLIPPPDVVVHQGDATNPRSLPQADAVITSPPYAATYDYTDHHALRLRWLGLEPSPLTRGELGSRQAYQGLTAAAARAAWSDELTRFLRAAAGALPMCGPLVLVLADSAVAGTPLRADEIVARVAPACGFTPAARASQPRPHFHRPTAAAFRNHPRAEHALLLSRVK